MKVLCITSLYPNSQHQRHGIFIETRMRQLRATHPDVKIDVVAPIPWFPFAARWMASRQGLAQVAPLEERHGLDVYHPRYLAIPGIGMYVNPFFMLIALCWFAFRHRALITATEIIDSHYIYPDGVAAVWFARLLKKSVMLTARGSDITTLPANRWLRGQIIRSLRRANACAGVCQALVDEMRHLAPEQTNYHVLRNGVDLNFFKPLPEATRQQLRSKRHLDGQFVILCVGNLIELKGQHLVIEALTTLPKCTLLLAGHGEMQQQLEQQVAQLQLSERVQFLGLRTPAQLVEDYNLADVLILPSSREGWANVLLEAMACGTPVLATKVWGTPEVVQSPAAGWLLGERSVSAIREAILQIEQQPIDRAKTRAYAESFSWAQTCQQIYKLFQQMRKTDA
jgi:glycosyltransferase involved in cell wall biosynthesis